MNVKKYIMFLCDLLVIDVPTVQIKENNKYYDLNGHEVDPFKIRNTAMATSYPKENKILVNIDSFSDGIEYIVLTHEIRHIYQWIAINDKLESKRLIKLWKNNFDNYLSSENDGYTNQPLEVDANAFTYIVMLALFNREITVKCNQKLLNKRIKELTLDFSKDEILDSYNYYF